MKKLMMLAAVAIMGASAFAQGGQRGMQMTPEQMAERNKQRIEVMDKAVSLTAEERAKVEEVFKSSDAEMAKIRQAMANDMAGMREKMTSIREEQNKKLKEILGEERFEKYQSAMPQRQGGMRQGGNQ